jgi:hypothetical protein
MDTLKAYDKLKSQFSEEQTRTLVETLPELIGLERLATKDDLEHLRLATKEDLQVLRLEIAAMENRLIRWVVGSIIGLGAFLAAMQAIMAAVLFQMVAK